METAHDHDQNSEESFIMIDEELDPIEDWRGAVNTSEELVCSSQENFCDVMDEKKVNILENNDLVPKYVGREGRREIEVGEMGGSEENTMKKQNVTVDKGITQSVSDKITVEEGILNGRDNMEAKNKDGKVNEGSKNGCIVKKGIDDEVKCEEAGGGGDVNMSLKDILEQAGLDPSYWVLVFKEKVGISSSLDLGFVDTHEFDVLRNHARNEREAALLYAIIVENEGKEVNFFDRIMERIRKVIEDMNNDIPSCEKIKRICTSIVQYVSRSRENLNLWVSTLKTEEGISNFFKEVVVSKDKFSIEDQEELKEFVKVLVLPEYFDYIPDNSELLKWLANETLDGKYSSDIKDLEGLHKFLKDSLLPTIEARLPLEGERVEELASDEVASEVCFLLARLEEERKTEELLLLLSLLARFDFSVEEFRFISLLTCEKLKLFTQCAESAIIGYKKVKEKTMIAKQAYLVYNLLSSVRSSTGIRDLLFQKTLKGSKISLCREIQHLIDTYGRSPPFNWEKISAHLLKFQEGVVEEEYQDEVKIDSLQNVFSKQTYLVKVVPRLSRHLLKDTAPYEVLEYLGLLEWYPCKITLKKVMTIPDNLLIPSSPRDIPWLTLKRLLMTDYKGREDIIAKISGEMNESTDDPFADLLSELSNDFDKGSDEVLNPLDVLIATLNCCNLHLRQVLTEKLFLCRLAVPLLFPSLVEDSLELSLWALRKITVEWKDKDQNALETSVSTHPHAIISFIRLGRPALSKARILNEIINERPHSTFLERESPLGKQERKITNGLIESAWYVPSGKEGDVFSTLTQFLNLRGDALLLDTQVTLISKVSSMVVVIVDIEDLLKENVLNIMMDLVKSKRVLLILSSSMGNPEKELQKEAVEAFSKAVGKDGLRNTTPLMQHMHGKKKNSSELKNDIRRDIVKWLASLQVVDTDSVACTARELGVIIDEDDPNCQVGKQLAQSLLSSLDDEPPEKYRQKVLPLQGDLWHRYCSLLKKQRRMGGKGTSSFKQSDELRQGLIEIRRKQVGICKELSPVIKDFISTLVSYVDQAETLEYFLFWCKSILDLKSRKVIPVLRRKYHNSWTKFKRAREQMHTNITGLEKEVNQAEILLANSSIGLEHFFREISQVYEAITDCDMVIDKELKDSVKLLPTVAAKLLLRGEPLELMDGDASNVPISWINGILESLTELIGDKKLFVLSVLGIQSSGKSTLLNTMFGVQFAVSAGRCTRGVYIQLIEVDKTKEPALPYDFLLLLDTEGLRSPELGQKKYNHDNELATLAIGMADVTVMNIKGGNTAEVKDVLQIAVHAFLRMKVVSRHLHGHKSCIFIHQNVGAVNAHEKMMHGRQKLQELLDAMTVEAAEQEHIGDIRSFSQVIEFDPDSSVWYFADLWCGDPPMAPINPGYSENVQKVKDNIFLRTTQGQKTFLDFTNFQLRISDVWNAIVADDFVFNFRNSLEIKAYKAVEKRYRALAWEIEKNVGDWLRNPAEIEICQCESEEEIQKCRMKLATECDRFVCERIGHLSKELNDFFESDALKEISEQWRQNKLLHLNETGRIVSQKASETLKNFACNQILHLVQNQKEKGLQNLIQEKALQFAQELKSTDIPEEHLKEIFEDIWSHWLQELSPAEEEGICIEYSLEQALYDQFFANKKLIYDQIAKYPLHHHLNTKGLVKCLLPGDIQIEDLSIMEGFLSTCFDMIGGRNTYMRINRYMGRNGFMKWRVTALEKINAILKNIETYIEDRKSIDGPYSSSYGRQMLKILNDKIEEHNNKMGRDPTCPFTMTSHLIVKLAVIVCRFAAREFGEMQERFLEIHGTAAKLAVYKETTWCLLKNEIYQRSQDVKMADLIIQQLRVLVKEAIDNEMPSRIVDDILKKHSFSKYQLIIDILDDLMKYQNFMLYIDYIENAYNFALKWIKKSYEKDLFKKMEMTKYAKFAAGMSFRILKCLREGAQDATREAQQYQGGMKKWVQVFCSRAKQEIPLREGSLDFGLDDKQVDFENLFRLMEESLKDLEAEILHHYMKVSASTVLWKGLESPYKQVMNKLWGCQARCPFCHEPCKWTDAEHEASHSCVQHRPEGITGAYWIDGPQIDQLLVEPCTFLVNSGAYFSCGSSKLECKKSGNCQVTDNYPRHPYKEYRKFIQDWDIAPSSVIDSSEYWMWFMTNYKYQLKTYYGRKLPDFPVSWNQIDEGRARNSLRKLV